MELLRSGALKIKVTPTSTYIVLPHPCDLSTVAKELRVLDLAITTHFNCTIVRDVEVAKEEMDIQMKERINERI